MSGGKTRDINYTHQYIGQRFERSLDFVPQYFHLYQARLSSLKHRAITASGEPGLNELTELGAGQTGVVAGIIIRLHKQRSSIIQHYIAKVGDPEPLETKYYDSEDEVYLEDESGRIKLEGTEDLVTGSVVSVKGCLENSVLKVQTVFYPYIDTPMKIESQGDEYIAFVSGLEVGTPNYDLMLLHLLAQFLQGNLGDQALEKARSIVRLVVLGDSLYRPDEARQLDRKAVADQQLGGLSDMGECLQYLDTFLAELAGSLPVDLIPGEADPTNASFPQQPISPYLLPQASRYSALNSFPNPYECTLDELRILCTSGQNVKSLAQFSKDKSWTEHMEVQLKLRHLAPTAPDALHCIPMKEDPFVLETLPHVYLCGCMPEYETKLTQEGVKLVSVPSFSKPPHKVVLLNRFTLETETITFESFL